MRFKLNSDKRLERLDDSIITLGENMADILEISVPLEISGYRSENLICVFSVDTGSDCIGIRLPLIRRDGGLLARGRLPGYLLSLDGSCRVELADGAGTVIKSSALPFSAAAGANVERVYDEGELPNDSAYEIFRGKDGKSAYELACEEGFTGSLADWLDSLSGMIGKKIRSVANVSRVDDTLVISYDDGGFDTFIISDGKDGVGIARIEIRDNGEPDSRELAFSMTDGTEKTISFLCGKDGESGADGIPCTHYWDGTVLTVTSASGTSSAELAGADGVSPKIEIAEIATGHSVTVTDAYGTHTFNVTDGLNGINGADGSDGYTPIRGTDYWTEADKAEIKSYVDEAILSGEW